MSAQPQWQKRITPSAFSVFAHAIALSMRRAALPPFTLPSAVNAEKHNQIKILTNLSVVAAINFGTDKYFNCEAPDMSEAGFYDIYIDPM